MLQLDSLKSLVKKRKRIGRGGSRGGTSGKGHKGQKARSGGSIDAGFEGGQTVLYRRLPKRGFRNARFKRDVAIVSLASIDGAFADGDTVNVETLAAKGLIKEPRSKFGVLIKVLNNGEISKKVTIAVDLCSKSAVQAVEKVGGTVSLSREK